MIMRWLFPATLLIGVLASKEAWHLQRSHLKLGTPGSLALLLFVGWFPFLIWLVNNFWPQN
jgi:hypothetical protein